MLPRIALCAALLAACGPSGHAPGDGGEETCSPGDTGACYDGPSGTEGVGPCHEGERTCDDDGRWGPCTGQVTPVGEVCDNGEDDNCNGDVDEDVDADGDGFTTCGGDCCDGTGEGCSDPDLVNPGAFEAPGNQLDDDCDGTADNVAATECDSGLPSSSSNAADYAKAIELCETATEAAGDLRWGLVEARFLRADGTGTPDANQRSIRTSFGGTTVQAGAAFAVLSTGHAAATGQTSPSFVDFQTADAIGTSSAFPASWLDANDGDLPNAPGCPVPDAPTARDPIMLELRIRTPTNAKSFSLATNFLSSEYPEWVCSAFNDFFVVLLDSSFAGSPANPADGNLATYTSPSMEVYPVGVNLAFADDGLFRVCENGNTGCAEGSVAGTITTCDGVTELAGTGMDLQNPPPRFADDVGYCGTNNLEGGGTGWLVTQGNVVGGEIITLRIAMWDTSDGFYDSVAIIDDFQWSIEPAQPGTIIVD